MIDFSYMSDFELVKEDLYKNWLKSIVSSEDKVMKELAFVFCDDPYLHELNLKYLNHDTFTDIITFDYTEGRSIAGEIFISLERVRENAQVYAVEFENELLRVMAHGVLHLLGYGDKNDEETKVMRAKEEEKIKMFHVEQLRSN